MDGESIEVLLPAAQEQMLRALGSVGALKTQAASLGPAAKHLTACSP